MYQVEPLVCIVTFWPDMAHYTPSFDWRGTVRKDLEDVMFNSIWDNIKNDIDIVYDTIDGITIRNHVPKIKSKKMKVNGVNVIVILK